jgi:DeoR/GlpR family transcriptional regulator of sugar metabolism
MIEVIRQSGNSGNPAIGCRLKELQNALPDVSERTLRYDLQRLIESGKIERLGSGGPATFYRARSVDDARDKSLEGARDKS